MINELKTFGIQIESELPREIAAVHFLIEKKCLSFLQQQMVEIKAPNLSVAASMFSKRYAFLVVSSTLYSMVKFNSALQLPIAACALDNERKLVIRLDMCNVTEASKGGRDQWREAVLKGIFSPHITPVLDVLEKTTRIPSSILWENVAVRINSVYRKLEAKEFDPIKVDRIKSDFNFLKNAGGDLFGLRENPIQQYLKIGEELQLNPKRKTCCMYHKLKEDPEGIVYCNNCPIT